MGLIPTWLRGGHDRALADSYNTRESASAKASRNNREGHRRNLTSNARRQQAREDTYWRNL